MEKKFLDMNIGTIAAPISIDATYTVLSGTISAGSFLGIVQGTTESQRIGRKVVITDLHWYIRLQRPNAAPTTTNRSDETASTCRIVLYIDKQCNGAAATGSQLFQIDDFLSFRNIENTGRFVILHDRKYSVPQQLYMTHDGTNDIQALGDTFQWREIHWKGFLPIEFNSTTGAISEIRSNNICAMVVAEDNGGSTQMVSRLRIRYYG